MRFTQRALVHILIAGSAEVSRGAGTEVASADGVGVAVGAFLTRVTDAGIVQLAQQTCSRVGEEDAVTPASKCVQNVDHASISNSNVYFFFSS